MAPPPALHLTPRLQGLQGSVTQWLHAPSQATSPGTAAVSAGRTTAGGSSPRVAAGSLAVAARSLSFAAGSLHLLASPDDLMIARASKVAPARRLEHSFRPTPPASQRAAERSMPEVASYGPPAQTRLPIGGAAAGASGSGGAAPATAAVFAALALLLATILLARLSLDLATWRSTLLASRLEHPG